MLKIKDYEDIIKNKVPKRFAWFLSFCLSVLLACMLILHLKLFATDPLTFLDKVEITANCLLLIVCAVNAVRFFRVLVLSFQK